MRLLGRLWRTRVGFCALVALLLVAGRLAFFDYCYFIPAAIPNHDMSQGAGLFATSLHSVRLTGEIAWWHPLSEMGYAQYYQSFLSPLAPTQGHVVFIAWAQLIRLLSRAGVRVPEYYQYLVVNYVVLPYLTSLAFAYLASLLFRHRAAVLLVCIAYTFSGIGLWNGAWFYFQESFSLFFLLGAAVAALRQPRLPRLAVLLLAGVVQFTSFNYWTLYNTFFFAIVLGSYAWFHPVQVRRLARRAAGLAAAHKGRAAVVGGGLAVVLSVWGVLIASIGLEQGGKYVRQGENKHFSTRQAYERVQEMRHFTTELFNPGLERAFRRYGVINEMHNARYLGCALLPFLVLLPVVPWRRRERWLVASAAGVLVVCLAPPFLLDAWKLIPFMDRIRHVFYFYTHHWQVLLVLLAGASMDSLLRPCREATRKRLLVACAGLLAVLLLLLAVLGCLSDHFPAADVGLQANLRAAVVAAVVTLILFQRLLHPAPRDLRLLTGVVPLVLLADLSNYFWDVSAVDRAFTARLYGYGETLPPDVRRTLRHAWADPDPAGAGRFDAGLPANMPIRNTLWPVNGYIRSCLATDLITTEGLFPAVADGPPLQFYRRAERAEDVGELARAFRAPPGAPGEGPPLFLSGAPPQALPAGAPDSAPPAGEFAYAWRDWTYNGFRFEVVAPEAGWVFIRQTYDPLWRCKVDGVPVRPVRAQWAGMALPVSAGPHHVEMDYRPLARGMYPVACLLLEGLLGGLAVLSFRPARRAPRGGHPAARPAERSPRAARAA